MCSHAALLPAYATSPLTWRPPAAAASAAWAAAVPTAATHARQLADRHGFGQLAGPRKLHGREGLVFLIKEGACTRPGGRTGRCAGECQCTRA